MTQLQIAPRTLAKVLVRICKSKSHPVAEAADRLVPRMKRTIIQSVQTIQDAVPMSDLEQVLSLGHPGTGAPLFVLEEVIQQLEGLLLGQSPMRTAAGKTDLPSILNQAIKVGAEAVELCVIGEKGTGELLVPDEDVLAVSHRVTKSLSSLEKYAFDQAGGGVIVGRTTAVDTMIDTDSELAAQIYNKFQPVRDMLQSKQGDKVTMFRAQGEELNPNKRYLNYASEETAKRYVEPGRVIVSRDVHVRDILAAYNPIGEYEEFNVFIDSDAAKNIRRLARKQVK